MVLKAQGKTRIHHSLAIL